MAYPGILRRLLDHIADMAAHGATAAATANRIARRDGAGRMQAADPLADQDVVNKRTLADRKINTTLPLTGGGGLSADLTLGVALATNAQALDANNNTTVITPATLQYALSQGGGGGIPQAGAGVGQWGDAKNLCTIVNTKIADNNPYSKYTSTIALPAGGTWAYSIFYFYNEYTDHYSAPIEKEDSVSGINAGGSVIATQTTATGVVKLKVISGFCWRIA